MEAALCIILWLYLLWQATGVEAAVYYTPETLEAVGITEVQCICICIA